ncbi:hypothetical protein H310_02288 [Aphanomyces invadans]|uniref:DDE-1 domain-containing protein n=1 Tax=Aphanomyces invadans TaxID=157072 RepID=A0A024UNJ5_9STRA|nr:hypothetical protein H310_02288 [Aphanomyces invadans]ETW07869.1 hypothetical protein H310_02288 [Aphanomyces invadans]|eukprot:XP_008863962.1 hypothetical protein H310_02288 [Aphanomyces invadans]
MVRLNTSPNELPTYPRDAIYAVQENAWMDEGVWDMYLRELLQFEIEAPSVVVVDNLSAHLRRAILSVETSTVCWKNCRQTQKCCSAA